MAAQEILRLERFLRKITQTEISKKTQIPQSTLSRIERGERAAKPAEQKAIAWVLGLPPADLFPEGKP